MGMCTIRLDFIMRLNINGARKKIFTNYSSAHTKSKLESLKSHFWLYNVNLNMVSIYMFHSVYKIIKCHKFLRTQFIIKKKIYICFGNSMLLDFNIFKYIWNEMTINIHRSQCHNYKCFKYYFSILIIHSYNWKHFAQHIKTFQDVGK